MKHRTAGPQAPCAHVALRLDALCARNFMETGLLSPQKARVSSTELKALRLPTKLYPRLCLDGPEVLKLVTALPKLTCTVCNKWLRYHPLGLCDTGKLLLSTSLFSLYYSNSVFIKSHQVLFKSRPGWYQINS